MVRYVSKPGTSKKSAQEYASQIDQIREKTSSMTLPEVDSNRN
jgi:hypothetical protein